MAGMMPPSMPLPSSTVNFSRWLAVSSLLALIALGLGWELLWAPLRPGGSWLVLKVLPLCFPLVGLLKNRMYTYRWVSLLVWFYVTEGVVRRGAKVRLIRDNVVIHEGELSTLKRFKDEVKEVQSGQECGMAFANYQDMQKGDVIECFDVETIQRAL